MNGHLNWYLVVLMAFLGVLTHFLKMMWMSRTNTPPQGLGPIDMWTYWVTCWPETAVTVLCSIGVTMFLWELNVLTNATAFFVGYMGSSMADTIGGRLQRMIEAPHRRDL